MVGKHQRASLKFFTSTVYSSMVRLVTTFVEGCNIGNDTVQGYQYDSVLVNNDFTRKVEIYKFNVGCNNTHIRGDYLIVMFQYCKGFEDIENYSDF